MSFLDCIATAVDAGKISKAKGAEAEEAYAEAFEVGKSEGLSDDVADLRAAEQATDAVEKLKKNQRWQKINEIRKQHGLQQQVDAYTPPKGAILRRNFSLLDDIMDQVSLTAKAVNGQLHATIASVLLKYQPKLAGLVRPIENQDNIVRGLFDETVDDEVRPMVEAVKRVIVQANKLLNLEGAHMRMTDNYRLPQSHDRFMVRNAGKAQWVGDHLSEGVLDWDIIEYGGKPVQPDKRQEVLERVYDGIVSQGLNRGIAGGGSFAERMSRERFLYYANADAWLDMQGKYGNTDFYSALVNHIDTTARHVALMRTFGPEPVAGKVFVEQSYAHKIGKMQADNPKDATSLESHLTKAHTRFDAQYQIEARLVDTGQGDMLVSATNTARSVIGTALLGKVVIASLSDAAYQMWGRQIVKMPWWHVIPNYVSALGNARKATQQMIDDGIIYESAISMAVEAQRYNVAMEGSSIARTLGEFNYRVQGAQGWTQTGRGIAGQDLQKLLARSRELPFDELPFVTDLRNLGITREDWVQLRDVPLYEPEFYSFGKGQFLRPIDMVRNAQTDAQRVAANKFMMFQEMFVRDMVPAPTVRTRQALGQHVPITGLAGQVLRTGAQLTLFPSTIMFNHWRKIATAPRFTDKMWRTFTLVAFTTGSGAFQAQIKDMLMGKEPDLNPSARNLARWAAMGGAGALLGDWIWQNVDAANSYYNPKTPTEEAWGKLKRVVWDNPKKYLEEEETSFTKDTTELVWGLLPKPVPFSLLMERGIHDSMLEWADPAAYDRKVERQTQQEEETGQGTWWGIDDE